MNNDQIKETINYYKLWLGVFLIADVSLIGWLSTKASIFPKSLLAITLLCVLFLTVFSFNIHKNVEHLISVIKDE